MGIASVQEIYQIGKMARELETCRNIITREDFPKEIRDVTKFNTGQVAIMLNEALDLNLIGEAAKKSGFYPVRERDGVTIYSTKSKFISLKNRKPSTTILDYLSSQAEWDNGTVGMYHDRHAIQFLNPDIRELKLLENYLKLKNMDYAKSRMSTGDRIESFFKVKGNPDRVR